MKKIAYIGEGKFLFGINELKKQLKFLLNDDGMKIVARRVNGEVLRVHTDKKGAFIEYPSDNAFFRGFSLALQHLGQEKEITVKPKIKELGSMQDCSDGLLSVEGVKSVIRQHALLGFTYVGLYTETTYKVENEPYFGYKGGAYSTQEIKEMVEYGEKFGIEIVPFIQTLGHFAQLFRWPAYSHMHDIHDTLLVQYDKTYELLENIFRSLRAAYKTTRINLGMDEAYFLGYGRYHWFINENNYDTGALFIEHVEKVIALAKKYGFDRSEIWFDNLFEIKFKGYIYPPDWLFKDGFSEQIKNAFPDVTLRFWHYAVCDVEEFNRCCNQIRQLSKKISFASITRGYTSFAPENKKTARLVDAAVEGCLQNGIDDIVITRWDGIQSPHAKLPAYYDFAERSVESSGYDIEKRCEFLFGYTYQEFLVLDEPNEILFEGQLDEGFSERCLPVYLLAEDLLLGIMEKHIPQNVTEYYENCAQRMDALAKKDSLFNGVFAFEKALCDALAQKGDLSRRIKICYDKGDKDGLLKLSEDLTGLIKQLEVFHDEYRKYWLSYNKSFGFELFDMRLGGGIARVYAVQKVLVEYCQGKIEKIDELEEERLPVAFGKENQVISYRNWNQIAVGRQTRL